MRKLAFFFSVLMAPAYLAAQCASGTPSTGTYTGATGPAQYLVVMPSPAPCYNGDVILYAHGYIPVGSPAGAWQAELTLPDGTYLPALANKLGFGFAASSFSKDGLAILPGEQDTATLSGLVPTITGFGVRKFFLVGPSEGALIVTRMLEQSSSFSGAMAACGPIGSFTKEIDYLGDVRVLFDYFFPGVLTTGTPGESAINIPPALILNWTSVYEPKVVHALQSNPLATLQFIIAAQLPIGLDAASVVESVTSALTYNVFATTDIEFTLGGNPYDNMTRTYHGSFNDNRLNTHVARFAASPTALANLVPYETTGLIHDPVVTLHTISDPIAPYWQETLYRAKVVAEHSTAELTQIPIVRYGHCNFTGTEAGAALQLMIVKAGL